jgi:hypothetical protein
VDPSASFSVYNSKGQLIERTKELLNPALSSLDQVAYALGEGYTHPTASSAPGTTLFWGAYWHMQTPLQNVEAGSVVLLELRDGAAELDSAGCYWTRYALDFASINSTTDEPLSLNYIQSSHGAASRRTMLTAASPASAASQASQAVVRSAPNGAKTQAKTAEARVDCVLHRRDRNVSLEEVTSS